MEPRKSADEERLDLLDVLVEDGVLARATADTVRHRQRETWIPLGKILRRKGALTAAQLVELLQVQSQDPRTRLGEVAVARGYCTRAQVEDGLRTQRELSPHVLDLVAEEAGVEPVKLFRAVTRYVRALEARVHGD